MNLTISKDVNYFKTLPQEFFRILLLFAKTWTPCKIVKQLRRCPCAKNARIKRVCVYVAMGTGLFVSILLIDDIQVTVQIAIHCIKDLFAPWP